MGLCFPGSSALWGPSAVSGPEGGSLSVQCGYDATFKTYNKWWCRGAVWGPCQILVQTTGSEQEVKKDRVSIRDNHKNLTFTVTMEKLREADADVYWCGIQRTGTDDAVRMTVSIGPAPTTVSSSVTIRMTTGPPMFMPATSRPSTTRQETPGPGQHSQSLLSSVHFLLLVFLKVPLFLIMLSAAFWVNRHQRVPRTMLGHPNQEHL
ncbi:CMRF35-like molecule 5 [Echinops telfairi]|uniref:CMRF35-like molecule 5 n=1 Tax=Echinops telfairi TaxID=9371 RepID=A0ABM0IWH4_ECHTE|nr:CMRF35-like molecule 5 [Echinops telfairi]